MEKNEIYLISGTDYQEMTLKILAASNLAEDIGDRNQKIAVKPNILDAIKAEKGATTHPELVDALLEYLLANGFKNLSVMEGAWVGGNTMHAAEYTGILQICRRHGVPFVDLQKDSFQACDAKGIKINVCSKALESDYFINVPVIKGHCQTTVTCALKNSKGVIPNPEKRRFHTMGLHAPIAHLGVAVRQDFILCDNICGDMDFEEGGNPIYMNRILCFKDPVLCDSFAAQCMGYEPRSIEYIRLAEELGVGSTDVENAIIKSLDVRKPFDTNLPKKENPVMLSPDREKSIDGANRKMNADATEKTSAFGNPALQNNPNSQSSAGVPANIRPDNRIVVRLAPYAAPNNACSACYASLMHALLRMDEKGELGKRRKNKISIGQGYRNQTGAIGVGSCTSCFAKNLKGCPPKAVDILEFLREEWE